MGACLSGQVRYQGVTDARDAVANLHTTRPKTNASFTKKKKQTLREGASQAAGSESEGDCVVAAVGARGEGGKRMSSSPFFTSSVFSCVIHAHATRFRRST